SNDPYALRRAAAGLIRILEKFDWHFNLSALTENQELFAFVVDRVKKLSADREIRHDLIEAAVSRTDGDVVAMLKMAKILESHKNHPPFKPTMEAVTRVNNILAKNQTEAIVNPELFEEAAETVLYQALQPAKHSFDSLSLEDKFRTVVHTLTAAINGYFDAVMVLSDDESQRHNHLALLQEVKQLTDQLGDLSLVNSK
ncbi:MAG: glycine--tRNA ligase subunit beta, partial [Streptococcaceae bacterium]|nr:glycine--tRNA ligase subunit beta [Streptococcaceae bacterium]